MEVERHVSLILGANSYLVASRELRELVVIDPTADLADELVRYKKEGFRMTSIIDTHGHFDHIGGNRLCQDLWPDARLVLHSDERDYLADPGLNLSSVFTDEPLVSPPAQTLVSHGDVIELLGEKWKVLHTPGHTPGSMCLWCGDVLFSGDTLFCGGYGRTDMPGGSDRLLARSLRALRTLPEGLILYPGHGDECNLGAALDMIGVEPSA